MNKQQLIYLAGPYTHKHKSVMRKREQAHGKAAGDLTKMGIHVYAPIPETCGMVKYGGLNETSWEFWRGKDLNQLSRCDEIWVMDIEGWTKSLGVKGEVKFAVLNNIPVGILNTELMTVFYPDQEELLTKFGVQKLEELND